MIDNFGLEEGIKNIEMCIRQSEYIASKSKKEKVIEHHIVKFTYLKTLLNYMNENKENW